MSLYGTEQMLEISCDRVFEEVLYSGLLGVGLFGSRLAKRQNLERVGLVSRQLNGSKFLHVNSFHKMPVDHCRARLNWH
ncbi:hypothetical protein [Ruegeria meonggei]|uniref:hypothetical protein n=1 Tax=Ruegeria meonggei TaxID=1446476 RepID=UPI003670D062